MKQDVCGAEIACGLQRQTAFALKAVCDFPVGVAISKDFVALISGRAPGCLPDLARTFSFRAKTKRKSLALQINSQIYAASVICSKCKYQVRYLLPVGRRRTSSNLHLDRDATRAELKRRLL
jgi:hypothetical protein